jgi:O-antigen ligase
MLQSVAAWCLPLALGVVTAWYGGGGGETRAVGLGLIAAGLLLTAVALPHAARRPPLGWWLCLFAVPVLQPLLQALPLGVGHPWDAPDRAALGVEATAWALDPERTVRAAAWAWGAAAAALLAAWAWRGARLVRLAEAVTVLVTIHAAAGLVLALLLPDWPSPFGTGRVRGSFVYANHAAAFWGACLPMALLLSRASPERRRWWLVAAAILGAALVLSASRGGILVVLLVSGPAAWMALPRRRRWAWAATAVAVVAAWLWVAERGTVSDRLSQLTGPQGATLNGRLLIWSSAAAALPEVGAFGLGAGGGDLAFRRGGEDAFGLTPVVHLHSDPLQWLVEQGWAGTLAALVGVLAAAALVWRNARVAPAADPPARAAALGATLGLLHLALHACGEFVWQREAIVLLASCWLAVAALAWRDPASIARHRPRWHRAALAAAGLLAAWAAWCELPRGRAADLAWDARQHAAARLRSGLDPHSATTVRRLAHEPSETVQGAVLAAELLLARTPNGMEPSAAEAQAERLLAAAATLSPADPDAWILRLELAVRRGDRAAIATASERVLHLTPGRPEARRVLIGALLGPAADLLPAERQAAIMRRALEDDWNPPPAFWDAAEERLGTTELAAALRGADPAVLRAGEPWLRTRAGLDDWLAARARLAPDPPRSPPELLLVAQAAWGATAQPELAGDPAGLLRQAQRLAELALEQPPALASALAAAGPPAAALAGLPALPGADARGWLARQAAVAEPLSAWLHLPWARAAWEDARRAAEVAAGRSGGLGSAHRPALLLAAWAEATDPIERGRLALALSGVDRGWTAIPGGQARWWWPEKGAAMLFSPGWVGVVVDGRWQGWQRGVVRVPASGPGLHRVLVLSPP